MQLGADFWMPGQQAGGEAFEVVEVEAAALVFAVSVFAQGLIEEAMEGGQVRGDLFIEGETRFFGEKFEMLVIDVFQCGHFLADSIQVRLIPGVFFAAACVYGFTQGGKGRKDSIPVLGGAGRLDFVPADKHGAAGEFEFVVGGGGMTRGEIGEGVLPGPHPFGSAQGRPLPLREAPLWGS